MSKKKIANGNRFNYTVSGSAVSSGDPIFMEDILGIAETDGEVGDTIAVDVTGVHTVVKDTGVGKAFAQGQKVYWDASNDECTPDADDGGSPTPTAFAHIGWAYTAAGANDTTVNVRLLLS